MICRRKAMTVDELRRKSNMGLRELRELEEM
nr:MAG TPA: hypothetical protein [Caudoviricetes sp.]